MSEWKCKKHGVCQHDIFLNYRVRSDADLAQKVFLSLSNQKRADGRPLTVFLDKYCLNDGEDWETGFLNGLENAALLVLLISEAGISGIVNANQWQDNVLLEYEYALEKNEKGQAAILPLLVGEVKGATFTAFTAFNTSKYPDEVHKSAKSSKNIRATMTALFTLQGIGLNPGDFEEKVPHLVKAANKSLAMLSRLGPPQEEKFDVNKCKLSVEDVSNKLKEWALDDFIPTFKKNAVDGPLLVSLKEEEFEKDLGVESRLIRRKLMQKIDELKSSVTNRDAYANVLFGFLQDGKITSK